MDYRHREVIKKYTNILQQSINLRDIKIQLSESKIFTTHMLKDIYDGEASFFEELPTRGPDAFHRFINLLKTNGYSSVADDLCHVANPTYQISDNHGYYYAFLNYDFPGFETAKELQEGFDLKFSALKVAFAKVGYKIIKWKINLTADKFYSKLRKFSEMNFNDVNSCIVIILGFRVKKKNSNGMVIYGRDGKYILLHDILNLFNDKNCPSLKHKPKIFLLPSFDISQNDSVENIELCDVNDTFLWHFPPLENYKDLKDKHKFFSEFLSENLIKDYQFDFETIFKSSYDMFMRQWKDVNNIPKCERLGYCRDKIIFTMDT